MVADKKPQNDDYWKEKWKELGQQLTVSGLNIATGGQEPIVRRILWIILIISGSATMSYQITVSVVEYLDRPVSVELKYEYVRGISFPEVTICNENQFMRSKVKALGIEQEIAALYPVFNGTVSNPVGVNQALLQNITAQFGSLRDLRRNTSQGLDELFYYCYFKGQPCDSTWFREEWTSFGLCYTFNPDKAASGPNVVSPGQRGGLWVALKGLQHEHIALYDYGSGYRIALHDPGLGYINMQRLGFRVSTGQVTDVEIHRSELSYLPKPYGTCTDGKRLRRFSTYTKDQCELECVADYIVASCGCISLFPSLPGERSCDLYEAATCADLAYFQYQASGEAEACECHQLCDQTTFSPSISYSVVSDYVLETFANFTGTTTSHIRGEVCFLLVYYPDIAYTSLTTNVAYTLTQLFNDIGGALGLMLGSTFLTVYEIIDFFVWAGVARNNQTKQVASDTKAKLDDSPQVSD